MNHLCDYKSSYYQTMEWTSLPSMDLYRMTGGSFMRRLLLVTRFINASLPIMASVLLDFYHGKGRETGEGYYLTVIILMGQRNSREQHAGVCMSAYTS